MYSEENANILTSSGHIQISIIKCRERLSSVKADELDVSLLLFSATTKAINERFLQVLLFSWPNKGYDWRKAFAWNMLRAEIWSSIKISFVRMFILWTSDNPSLKIFQLSLYTAKICNAFLQKWC